MTKLQFSYDLDKDVENFLKGTRSKNNPKPTKLQQAYVDVHGPIYNEETVRVFLQSKNQESDFNAPESVQRVEQDWRKIESVFFERVEKIFGISYPIPVISVYLSINGRSTYNIEVGYFFVYVGAGSTNRIIMHELLHFYTQQAFRVELERLGIDADRYNNVKESLTELLNIEFADLMDGARDEGYPQHAKMRQVVHESWIATKDIRRTVLDAFHLVS